MGLNLIWSAVGGEVPAPVPLRVQPGLRDVAEPLPPMAIHLGGWLGARVAANAANRLLNLETEPLLVGFRTKPGSHPWIGEHVGKWLHAATLAWANSGDPRLRAKLDAVAAELMAAQEPDGYLGTYVPEKRFGLFPEADWDVWSHKYNLLGLLTYYQYTGNEQALAACRKMGDLLVRTFGPGKQSILSAGTQVGMAATSVLEPMVLLYGHTGDPRYLDFAKYLVSSWDEPGGPRIGATLLKVGQVNQTANGKAYEMLSNLVGLCELARATGDRGRLDPVLNAWQDIVSKRLYLTGSASQAEHFHGDFELPNQASAHVAETCVTTTWIQLNLQLLRLTGEAKYANELEKTIYNHLTAAQRPRGDDWCYFTPLDGRKPYDAAITCCHSSGPRGLALAPFQTYLRSSDARMLLVNTFETSSAFLRLNGVAVRVEQASGFPYRGETELRFKPAMESRFGLKLRVPEWTTGLDLRVNGSKVAFASQGGWAVIAERKWTARDRLTCRYDLKPRQVIGEHGNAGFLAFQWGPFVLAYDSAENPGLPPAALLGLAATPKVRRESPDQGLRFSVNVRSPRLAGEKPATLLTFADAGASGGTIRVWLPAPQTPIKTNASLLAGGAETRSRPGNVEGSINDGDPSSFVVTFDGRKQPEDWFGVELDKPIAVQRIVFVAGKVFHDGGWFDSSGGKPRVEIQREPGGGWIRLAEFSEYPATTATDAGPLSSDGVHRFTIELKPPAPAVAVRVIGVPACGDSPQQAFCSCGELEAF